jgi:hypothetical protein
VGLREVSVLGPIMFFLYIRALLKKKTSQTTRHLKENISALGAI